MQTAGSNHNVKYCKIEILLNVKFSYMIPACDRRNLS